MAKIAPGDAPAFNLQADKDDEPKPSIVERIKETLDIYGDTMAPMDKLKPVHPAM